MPNLSSNKNSSPSNLKTHLADLKDCPGWTLFLQWAREVESYHARCKEKLDPCSPDFVPQYAGHHAAQTAFKNIVSDELLLMVERVAEQKENDRNPDN